MHSPDPIPLSNNLYTTSQLTLAIDSGLTSMSALNTTALALPNTSYNGLGMVPQMGWNSWNTFGCSISEDIILKAAQALVDSGLSELGYTYVLIDDCWHASARHSDGRPKEDPTKFPRGLSALVDDIHNLGLKAGIYSSAGIYTCGLEFGSLGYEEIDAKAYADWGFDYLKYDNCFSAGQFGTAKLSYDRYKLMSNALVNTGRDIFYSICNWGQDQSWMWATTISNSYRMSGDIDDTFNQQKDWCPFDANSNAPEGHGCSIANILEKASPILQKQVRGAWADLDMLEVGNGGMSTDEYIVHFTMWALLKSPLILGNDLTNMDEVAKNIVSNKALIAINQIMQGSANPAQRVKGKFGEVQIWKGSLPDGAYTVAIINFTDEDIIMDVLFKDIFRDDGENVQAIKFKAVDLWAGFFYSNSEDTAFGSNDLPDTVSDQLSQLEIRKHAGRFWVFKPIDEEEEKKVLIGKYNMQSSRSV
ncbi:alpha-galactosidase [Phaffia rhodozyma]|uniref:Alpha-galactosidase n=1 Tax=Phaffia rhodozyma TaxID=264483 RepID=A0A0F7STC2_PHARH|nr:alpha-galactosidase [Phaffia rhodozyma]